MNERILFWIAVIGVALTVIGVGVAFAVSNHPDRAKAAKAFFVIAALVLAVGVVYWTVSTSHRLTVRTVTDLVLFGLIAVGLKSGFRFADRSLLTDLQIPASAIVSDPRWPQNKLLFTLTIITVLTITALANTAREPNAIALMASWLWNMPLRWILPTAVIVFILTSVINMLRHRRQRGERGGLGGLQFKGTGTVPAPRPNEWLHKIADDDLAKIQNLVRVVGVFYEPVFSKAVIDFTFSIFNNSLYDIVIENSIKGGAIRFGEDWDKFHYKPQFQDDVPILCRARSGTWFVIRQPIRREEADRLKENDFIITFDGLFIDFKSDRNGLFGPKQLDFRQLYLETKKRAIRRLDQLDIIFMYSDEQWAALKNEGELNVLRKQTKVLQEGMKDRKVIFQVDDTQSQVHVSGGASARRIAAKIRLRCEKAISDAVAIKEFHAALCQETSNGDIVIIEREHAQVVWAEPKMDVVSMENGWTITEPLTPYRWFSFFLDIPSEVEAKLDRDHFIRVSMLAVGQESRAADFHVDSWSDARHSNSPISFR